MLTIFEFIYTHATWLIVTWLTYRLLSFFLTPRSQHFVVKLLLFITLGCASNVVIYPEELIGTLGYLLLFSAAVFIFNKGTWLVKSGTVIIFFPISAAISFLTQDIGLLAWIYLFDSTTSPLIQTLIHFFCMLLRVGLWLLIYRITKNWISAVISELTPRMWLLIDAISLTSCISIVTIIYKANMFASYVAYPACIACVLTSLGCCYLCSYISESLKAEMKIQTYKYQQSYYQELEENQKTIRKLKHDMNNHLNIIGTFLRDGDLPRAQAFFTDLSTEFVTSSYTFCRHSLINAVLNAKYALAQTEGIHCTFKLDLEEALTIDDISLCSLLSNSLDNAIEACQKIETNKERWITLSARQHNGHFSYQLKNSKDHAIQLKKGQIITDKEDKDAHGIGLRNIRELVEKYQGHLDISYTDQDFSLVLLI